MANPRKFSEKIALHTHRQAEETAAFEKIMKEVSDVKPNEEPPPSRLSSAGSRQSRTRSPVGPIRTTRERKPSPYSSGPYLSPPSDTGWRRTNSDSALHQSAMQVDSRVVDSRGCYGMGMDRVDPAQRVSWSMLPTMNGPDSRNSDGRPRSSCDIPRVPGIHIYPSAHDPGMVQIPIGNNTGSLPDLTNMDFTSPIHAPLDQDQDNSSPYSSSPINTSPSTLSPTSMMPGVRNHNSRFNFTPPISQSVSNHLSVPNRYSRFQQRSLSQNDKSVGPPENIDFSQIGAIGGMYQQPGSPASPVQLPQMDNYRSSQRPSPQPSPTLGGRHSAPCSPGEPSPIANDYHIHNQSIQFQQHFEQLTVSDPPISQMSYATDQSGAGSPQQQQQQMTHSQPIQGLPPDGKSDPGYYSTSPSQQHPLVYPSTSPGLHNTSPNTPTSLPEIILTDFSAGQDITRLDTPEFLTDDQLREGLGSLDFAELQMLGGMSEIVEDYRS
ncbi:CREB-regulated transcription coactivator 1-like isoform X2 [Anthonomus grandis grandis]|uniref:CREB-regulated transcription coactivator 1-like isoform X2 n=1 Tax=Anthonomus grandis grandis TaxID=2921223 RepID=UPI002166BF37|nr:CREB-regulated transcription coactivator 1-like isoform X2 [Anthonomus grandis grandis]